MATNNPKDREGVEPADGPHNVGLGQPAPGGAQPKGREPNKPNDQPTASEQKAGEGAEKAPYVVAPGKALVGARGILEEGKPIRPEDVGGQEGIDRLLKKGSIVKS